MFATNILQKLCNVEISICVSFIFLKFVCNSGHPMLRVAQELHAVDAWYVFIDFFSKPMSRVGPWVKHLPTKVARFVWQKRNMDVALILFLFSTSWLIYILIFVEELDQKICDFCHWCILKRGKFVKTSELVRRKIKWKPQ